MNSPRLHFEQLEERILLSGSPTPDVQASTTEVGVSVDLNQSSQQEQFISELVFIDSSVKDYQGIIDGLQKNVEIYIIDSETDGIQRISSVLENRRSIDAIHIISHGSRGQVQLGSATINNSNIAEYQEDLKNWQTALSKSADILIYGCNVGQNETFLENISNLTGADIAASNDVTGNEKSNGDWILENTIGDINTKIIISQEIQNTYQYTLDETFDFNSLVLSDSGVSTFTLTEGTDTLKVTAVGDLLFEYSFQIGGAINGAESLLAGDVAGVSGGSGVTSVRIEMNDGSTFDLGTITLSDEDGSSNSYTFTTSDSNTSNQSIAPASAGQTIDLSSNTDFDGITFFTITRNGGGSLFFGIDDISLTNVTPVNLPPAIGNLNGDSFTYNEGDGQSVIDQGASLTVSDGDSSDFGGGNLTVTITSGEDASEDRLSFDSGAVTLSGQTAGASVTVDSQVIGTLGNNIAAGNDLVVNFTALATLSRVQTLTRAITYENTDTSDPSTGARNVRVTINDGDGGTSSNNDVTISVVSVNDEPTLTATGTNPAFTEGGSASSLFSSASASTIESGQTLAAMTFTVTNVNDGSNERINADGTAIVLTHGTSGTTATNSLGYSVSVSGTTATVTFTGGTLSTAALQTLVNAMSYQNNSNDPNTSNRVVTLTSLQDSGSNTGSNDNTAALAITSTVTITGVNDEPTLTATGTNPTFTEGGSASSLFSSASASTIESGQTLAAMTFTVTNVNDGSNERINADGTAIVLTHGTSGTTATNSLGYSVSVSGSTATVTLSGGTLSVSALQTLINGMSYQNNSNPPDTSSRVITITSLQDSGSNVGANDNISSLSIASTVSVVAAPQTTSATYNSDTNTLVVTGVNFIANAGASNDIDITKLTLTGEGGATHTLTAGQTANVEIDSATQFTVTLGGTDVSAVEALLNVNGTESDDSTAYNLAAADNFVTAYTEGDTSDATNTVTVSGWPQPAVTSSTYDYTTGVLVVTGVDFSANGGGSDVDVSTLTFTGEGGVTYTLTDSSDVEIDNATQFTVTLSATDKAAVNAIINKDGSSSTGGQSYNLAAADNFITAVTLGDTSDTTGNGITVNNVIKPTITTTSVSYDVSTGVLTVNGLNIPSLVGSNNDIDVSLLTLQGEGGATYTLTSSDVDRTSATQFSITLNATDQSEVQKIFNKNGQLSTDISTYLLNAAEDWAAGADSAVNVVDTSNILIVSNVPVPTITSATYDASTNVLVVTGEDFLKRNGALNDIDISSLTFTGEGGSTYTLTSASDVEITSATQFTVTLAGADITGVEALLNVNGTESDDSTTYNLAAADNWNRGADSALNIADGTAGITVSGHPEPTITDSDYDYTTGVLVVTGTNFTANGGGADVDVSTLTFTGEGGVTYTLTDSSDVEIDNATQFTVTLSVTDKAAVNALINKDGTSSTGGQSYNLASADNFITAITAGNTADASNEIDVSNVIKPTITTTLVTYDVSTGILTVNGLNIPSFVGSNNDIDVSLLTLQGEGGATYTLTSSDVDRTSATQFSVTLNATDQAEVQKIFNKNGQLSTDISTYLLNAAEDWAAGADSAVNVVDTSNILIVSNVPVPTITSATYDASTNVLVVTGEDFLKRNGALNDIDISTLTFTGEGGATYTLTSASDVEITSATQFTVILAGADITGVENILHLNGTQSDDGTTYNLAVADDWNRGADSALNIADTTATVTVSGLPVPTIDSSTFDGTAGVLVVTGTNFVANGGGMDVDASTLTFTGEGGATYTLTDTPDVEIDSATQFTLTLSSADLAQVNSILNNNGTTSTGGTIYNLAAADNFITGQTQGDISDATATVNVSNVPVPTITSASYNQLIGSLVVTGVSFFTLAGAANDIDVSLLSITGEAGEIYSLTSSDVDITSATQFTVNLNANDIINVNRLLNKNGTQSNDGTTYNLAASDNWMTGAAASINIADATNVITVSNVAPAITPHTYVTPQKYFNRIFITNLLDKVLIKPSSVSNLFNSGLKDKSILLSALYETENNGRFNRGYAKDIFKSLFESFKIDSDELKDSKNKNKGDGIKDKEVYDSPQLNDFELKFIEDLLSGVSQYKSSGEVDIFSYSEKLTVGKGDISDNLTQKDLDYRIHPKDALIEEFDCFAI